MKKQILFLILFVAAIVAGTSKSYGQAVPSTVLPDSLIGCADYPLHPKAGIEYAYRVDTTWNHGNNDPLNFFWWATKNPVFVDTTYLERTNLFAVDTFKKYNVGTGELISAGSNYGVSGTLDSIQITWSPEILAATEYRADATNWQSASYTNKTPTFVAIMAAGSCTNNLQVFEINPLPSFTVDVASIDPGAGTTVVYGDSTEACVDVVRSAIYNSSTSQLDMDYGTDTVYFEVISANFVNKWLPYFEVLDGLMNE